jgi:hypothetical protein
MFDWFWSFWASSPRINANAGFPEDSYNKTHENIDVNTYDNGGIPFRVVVSPRHKTVKIFKRVSCDDDDDGDWKNCKFQVVMQPTKYKRIFVGRDASPIYGSGSERDQFYGNSVFFQLASDPRTYVFVGYKILSFRPSDDILSYRSDMGGSGVPYPFAVGTENTYLMVEEVFIPNHMLYKNDKMGPYEQYYGHDVSSKSDKYKRNHRARKLKRECGFKAVKLIHDRL